MKLKLVWTGDESRQYAELNCYARAIVIRDGDRWRPEIAVKYPRGIIVPNPVGIGEQSFETQRQAKAWVRAMMFRLRDPDRMYAS